MNFEFYQGDEMVMSYYYSPKQAKAAALFIYDWLIYDGWSVACKGRRIYKDCRFSPTPKLVEDFIAYALS